VRDRDFVRAFEDCTLPPEQFPHRAHVRLAWLYLREGSLLDALPRFVEGLKRYAASLGAATKYHETVTWAYMILIHERMPAPGARPSRSSPPPTRTCSTASSTSTTARKRSPPTSPGARS
jgi:hypothetical protein